jgi:hypothetical protein
VAEHLDGDVGRDFFLNRSLCALLLRTERPQKPRMDPLALRDSGVHSWFDVLLLAPFVIYFAKFLNFLKNLSKAHISTAEIR